MPDPQLRDWRPVVLAAADWAATDGPYTRFSARVLRLQPTGRPVLHVAVGFDLDNGRPVDWSALFEAETANAPGLKRYVAGVLQTEKLKALVRAHAPEAPGGRKA